MYANKFLVAVIAVFTPLTFSFAGTIWKIDKGHSAITFKVSHRVISKVYGKFNDFEVKLQAGQEDFTDAKIEATIMVKSINTDVAKRDEHLLSSDFFNSDKYPYITFKNVILHKKKDKHIYTAEGDLTIKNTTKKVTFEVEYGGSYKNKDGKKVVGFSIKTLINRTDFNLNWGSVMESVGAVGKEVSVEGAFEFIQQ